MDIKSQTFIRTGEHVKLRRIFVIVPSLEPSGPVRGAIALCNGIVEKIPVTLVVIKHLLPCVMQLDKRVNVLDLGSISNWQAKRQRLISMLQQIGSRANVGSISFCLSADILNFTLKRYAVIASSVRGNLPKNYRYDYGPIGRFIAYGHILALHRFDFVVAMSKPMCRQLQRFGLRRLRLVDNFIDEKHLESYRYSSGRRNFSGCKFLFLGSLTKRKRPELLVNAVHKLIILGMECHLDIIGDGPMREKLKQLVQDKNLDNLVTFHGQVNLPYKLMQDADYMILPSESEGMSRAVLEALFFGIPCVLRDVDANRSIIKPGINGELFKSDDELYSVLKRIISERRLIDGKDNMLQHNNRQSVNVIKYFELFQ